MKRYAFFLLVPIFLGSPLLGDEKVASEESRPAVTKIGEHQFRLGGIEFHGKTREILIPVTVNMREGGPIEYLLVHENGKTHEAIFTTSISPLHLQVVMKLLKFQLGAGDVFNRLLPPEVLAEEGGEVAGRGESVSVRFLEEGKKTAIPASETIRDGYRSDAMPAECWVYTGSHLDGETFLAEAEGSIFAIYLDASAMFNLTCEGVDRDERWGANEEVIPEVGTKGTLILSPAKSQP